MKRNSLRFKLKKFKNRIKAKIKYQFRIKPCHYNCKHLRSDNSCPYYLANRCDVDSWDKVGKPFDGSIYDPKYDKCPKHEFVYTRIQRLSKRIEGHI